MFSVPYSLVASLAPVSLRQPGWHADTTNRVGRLTGPRPLYGSKSAPVVTVHPGPSLARQAQRLNLGYQPGCQSFVKGNFVLVFNRHL
jgi:hypothetical protein